MHRSCRNQFFDRNRSTMYLRCFLHQPKNVLSFDGKISPKNSSFSFNLQEVDPICRKLQLIQNCCDQLYYPLEHIAWARDVAILSGRSDKFWGLGCCLWVVSLLMGIFNAVRKLHMLHKKVKAAKELSPVCEHLSRWYVFCTFTLLFCCSL